jgi:GGDEF domain-containing protein
MWSVCSFSSILNKSLITAREFRKQINEILRISLRWESRFSMRKEGQMLTVLIEPFRNSLAKAPRLAAFCQHKYFYSPYDSSRDKLVFIYNIQRLLALKQANSLLGDARNESHVIYLQITHFKHYKF